jgi:hypothetical protein
MDMRYVIALFDAPAPAIAALSALDDAGFSAGDVVVLPSGALADLQQAASLSGAGSGALVRFGAKDMARPGTFLHHVASLDQSDILRSCGVADDVLNDYLEALERGAILVLVRCPTLSAPRARSALSVAGAADLETQRRRWEADPDLRYGWRQAHVH